MDRCYNWMRTHRWMLGGALALLVAGWLDPALALVLGGGGALAIGTVNIADDVLKYLKVQGFLDVAGGLKLNVVQKTANYTILSASDPSSTVFTNRGAASTITYTLPAAAANLAGVYYDFVTIVAQIITVATPVADTLISDNDAAADSLSTTARIGVSLRLYCDGTSWVAVLASGVPQAAFAQTGTVAT